MNTTRSERRAIVADTFEHVIDPKAGGADVQAFATEI